MQEIYGPEGGTRAATLFDFRGLLRPEVVTKPALAYTALGFDVDFGTLFFPAGPKDRALHVKWCKLSTQLFAEGKLKARTLSPRFDSGTRADCLCVLGRGHRSTRWSRSGSERI